MQPPWSLFEPHHDKPHAFFLDRAGDSSWSFAGSRPVAQLVVEHDGGCRRWNGRRWRHLDGDPIDAIEAFVERSAAATLHARALDAPVTLPRTVGFLGYELGRFIEDVPVAGPDPTGAPLAVLSTYDEVDAWHPRLAAPRHVTFTGRSRTANAAPPLESRPAPNAARDAGRQPLAAARYRAGFARIKEAIGAGEIYQANLSRRITLPFTDDPVSTYRRLRQRQPVPQGAYLDAGDWTILSNSPECFLRVHDDRVQTFPIKGTRPRLAGAAEDARMRAELAADPKERAEHLMIVDLERNDLGRVCEIGSVDVPSLAEVRSFRTVHHLVSQVRGRLRPECGLAALLRAAYPGGSITGAPKIRAMEIIADVEPCARGVYTGAIGCFNGSRSVELSVAIRTAVVAGAHIHYCTGGGIVADSELTREYQETVTKARAFLDCVAPGSPVARAAVP
jgi:para-aminobenzoate synthetase component 1